MTRPFIMVAPNGARRGKEANASLPITLPEMITTAASCQLAGADALHLHVRDAQGRHTIDVGLYREATSELALKVPELEVQITTEAAGIFDVPAQYQCLRDLQPKWASVSIREMARDLSLAPKVYDLCAENNTKIQHILYNTDDIALLLEWQKQSIVKATQDSVLFVLGRYTQGQVSSPDDLTPFRQALPNIKHWMVCAFGPDEHRCLAHAAHQGGAVRVGFENSLVAPDGTPHADNAASITALINTIEKGYSA
ncbi:3-keto-5-aminohexanoate cleavage protein [Marinomonas algarum]|uniref:3-keto-5-aminohexanoate cleavage protein n=1 Tax=Marinomonas algarum TaxID=2883105 RepID=A0A9X1LC32_9GAMM|nr:3-keto-5-aminohexanoate cleavage protein [Marinomonas algarum]MCB5161564.1 3-keto-5-aminohexanoate cleavage protein [Marinomonas algarum]